MEEMIMQEGFIKSENSNDFIKGNWTIRLDKDMIEIFNNPELESGLYYCGPIGKVNLETIFDEIKNFEYRD